MQITKSAQHNDVEEENTPISREQLIEEIFLLTDEQVEYILRRLLCREQQ